MSSVALFTVATRQTLRQRRRTPPSPPARLTASGRQPRHPPQARGAGRGHGRSRPRVSRGRIAGGMAGRMQGGRVGGALCFRKRAKKAYASSVGYAFFMEPRMCVRFSGYVVFLRFVERVPFCYLNVAGLGNPQHNHLYTNIHYVHINMNCVCAMTWLYGQFSCFKTQRFNERVSHP